MEPKKQQQEAAFEDNSSMEDILNSIRGVVGSDDDEIEEGIDEADAEYAEDEEETQDGAEEDDVLLLDTPAFEEDEPESGAETETEAEAAITEDAAGEKEENNDTAPPASDITDEAAQTELTADDGDMTAEQAAQAGETAATPDTATEEAEADISALLSEAAPSAKETQPAGGEEGEGGEDLLESLFGDDTQESAAATVAEKEEEEDSADETLTDMFPEAETEDAATAVGETAVEEDKEEDGGEAPAETDENPFTDALERPFDINEFVASAARAEAAAQGEDEEEAGKQAGKKAGENLLSRAAADTSAAALKELMRNIPKHKHDSPTLRADMTLEELVIEAIRPHLAEWLNENLPDIVKQLVQKEIKKLLPDDE